MHPLRKIVCAAAFAVVLPAAAVDLPFNFAAMNMPVTPFRITDDIYYVGASDVTSFLIVTDNGLILTDGGFESTAPQIAANIKTLGFDIRNVRILLNSHAHFDHAGGLARLKALSGARLLASRADAALIESGGRGDFSLGDTALFPPAKVDDYIADNQRTTLGHTTLTAHLTPGHTKGCTSWTMTTHIEGKPYHVLFICSLTVLPNYHLLHEAHYPNIAADYAATFRKLHALPCDIMLSAHGSFFDLAGKRAKLAQHPVLNPFVDPAGCRAYIDGSEKKFQDALAKERAAP